MPLYFDGARMTYFSAIMPISDGMGLVFSVTSYDGMIFISATSCREQLPDPEFFAQCIRDSFQEYLALADAPPSPRRAAKRPVKRPDETYRRSAAQRVTKKKAAPQKGNASARPPEQRWPDRAVSRVARAAQR